MYTQLAFITDKRKIIRMTKQEFILQYVMHKNVHRRGYDIDGFHAYVDAEKVWNYCQEQFEKEKELNK